MENGFRPRFQTINCSALTAEQLKACSTLYSENYGRYSGKDDISKQGNHIKLAPSYYVKFGENPNMYVSLCYNGNQLLGYALLYAEQLASALVITFRPFYFVEYYVKTRRKERV